MATHKVIQDIEAEDKFVGPLTLKQFVFAMFGALFAYLSFFILTKGFLWGLLVTLPPTLFSFFMAVPWSNQQPTDVWVLAKVRFRLKPKKRIWDQAGLQQLVTITAPKKEEKQLTKNLTQTEVKSRLKALAETIDSRGWVIKNAPVGQFSSANTDSDRLIDTDVMAQVPDGETPPPDMMEEEHGLDNMIKQARETRRQQLYEKMDQIRNGGGQPETAAQPEPAVLPPVSDKSDSDEQALSASLKASRKSKNVATSNMHSLPSSSQSSAKRKSTKTKQTDDNADEDSEAGQKTEAKKAVSAVTEQPVPDILELARNNDLNVSTIARQANKENSAGSNEVVVSLH